MVLPILLAPSPIKKYTFPWTTLSALPKGPAKKSWVYWFTKSCIVFNTMLAILAQEVWSKESQVFIGIPQLFLSYRLMMASLDFVRLHQGYSPPHWKPTGGDKWDTGYERTAYFLDWIETRYGDGTIKELNEWMKDNKYHRRIFKELTGRPVRKLWKMYCSSLEESDADSFVLVSKLTLNSYQPLYPPWKGPEPEFL